MLLIPKIAKFSQYHGITGFNFVLLKVTVLEQFAEKKRKGIGLPIIAYYAAIAPIASCKVQLGIMK